MHTHGYDCIVCTSFSKTNTARYVYNHPEVDRIWSFEEVSHLVGDSSFHCAGSCWEDHC